MGCWEATCGISQTPIREGERVAAVLIRKVKSPSCDYQGCTYSDSLYEPVSPAIFGEYADYGRVNFDEDTDMRILEAVYGKTEENSIFKIISTHSSENGIYMMLFHLELYESIVNVFSKKSKFYTKGKSIREHLMKETSEYLSINFEERRFRHSLQHNMFKYNTDYVMNYYQDENLYGNLEKDPLISKMIDLFIFKDAMNVSRKLWVPQSGNGSQELSYTMAKMSGDFARKREQDL